MFVEAQKSNRSIQMKIKLHVTSDHCNYMIWYCSHHNTNRSQFETFKINNELIINQSDVKWFRPQNMECWMKRFMRVGGAVGMRQQRVLNVRTGKIKTACRKITYSKKGKRLVIYLAKWHCVGMCVWCVLLRAMLFEMFVY